MLGHSHALSGACTGLAAGLVMHLHPPMTLALTVATAGAALIPDLDSCGSCSARALGPISRAPSYVIRTVSGGHRHATHSIIGVAAFGGLAVLATAYRHDLAGKIGLGFLVTLIVAGGLEALRVTRHGLADLIGVLAAVAVIHDSIGLTLIPVAIIGGCAAHLAGDMLTESGVPLLFPVGYRFKWWPRPLAFETGTLPELLVIDPVLTCLAVGLAAAVLAPGPTSHIWHIIAAHT